ncbi:serine/threonine-protein kinase atg1-like [Folsomia candida]|uniref:Mitogen-activated protein kinase MMK2 n=1 Tax=Folsomia candida TaxID=158441 RepID=A0A226DWE6_FOLCA|nr:serine/threonine-protein kinase atg1-like [Folsomia candida]OXA49802.1 Mitogen-activated protein kinase MMK2 [Folsomia candida]
MGDTDPMDHDSCVESLTSWFDYLSLESFLGCGSFGYVFKGISGQTNLSAVKVIFIDAIGNQLDYGEDNLRLSREYKLMRGKKHDNLVEILKATDTPFTEEDVNVLRNIRCLQNNDDVLDQLHSLSFRAQRKKQIPTLCIQMELCGKTLRHWLTRNNEIDNPELHPIRKKIVMDMYEGLKYLHNNKIMHRDFRPENIMFSFSQTGEEFAFPVKVGDFGLCRNVHGEHTVTKTLTCFVGSVTYRAPETNFSDYSIPADLYSFGLVSWEILQQIKQKDTRSMFHRLVHDAETSLIKGTDWWFRNWTNIIINLTKRRVQDRIKGHGDIFLIDSRQVTVESHEEFSFIQGQLVAGDIININIMEDIVKSYHFVEDNLTFNGVNALSHQNVRIVIGGNHCTINNLTLEFLGIKGNNNVVSNVICDFVDVIGDENQLSNIEICHPEGPGRCVRFGIIIRGNNNVLTSFNCYNVSVCEEAKNHVYNIEPGADNLYAFVQQYGSLCLYVSHFSQSCTINGATFCNGLIEGTKHILRVIKCSNAIQICGKDHTVEDVEALNLIDGWTKTEFWNFIPKSTLEK